MGLLVSFFVMLVAFSTQDQQKLQVVAGSMREAFGGAGSRALFRHHRGTRTAGAAGYGPWELSADRANAVRQILAEEGVQPGHMFMVAGKADTDPLFADNPYMSPNRRVTITLMREEPPIPVDFKP